MGRRFRIDSRAMVNNFKIRTNGQPSIDASSRFGLSGAPQNIGIDPDLGTPGNTYDGSWEFYINVPYQIPEFLLKDGDFDMLLEILPYITEENQSVMKGEWGIIRMFALQYPEGTKTMAQSHVLRKLLRPSIKDGVDIPESLDDIEMPTLKQIESRTKKINSEINFVVLREDVIDV